MSETGPTQSTLVTEGLSYATRGLSPRGRALVLLTDQKTDALVVRAVHGFAQVDPGPACTEVLRLAQETQKTVLVLDATQDQRLTFLEESEIRSALCVPVTDGGHRMVGLLYADDPGKVGAFSPGERTQWESFCRELGRRLQKAPAEYVSPAGHSEQDGGRPEAPAAPVLTALLLIGLSLLLGLFGVFSGSHRSPPESSPSPGSLLAEEVPPRKVAESFCVLLRLREYEQAWKLLSPAQQEAIPLEQFRERVQGWFTVELHRWEFQYRRVLEGDGSARTAVVYVEPGPETGVKDSWEWTLGKTESGWRIQTMKGAPLEALPGARLRSSPEGPERGAPSASEY